MVKTGASISFASQTCLTPASPVFLLFQTTNPLIHLFPYQLLRWIPRHGTSNIPLQPNTILLSFYGCPVLPPSLMSQPSSLPHHLLTPLLHYLHKHCLCTHTPTCLKLILIPFPLQSTLGLGLLHSSWSQPPSSFPRPLQCYPYYPIAPKLDGLPHWTHLESNLKLLLEDNPPFYISTPTGSCTLLSFKRYQG